VVRGRHDVFLWTETVSAVSGIRLEEVWDCPQLVERTFDKIIDTSLRGQSENAADGS